MQLVRKEKLVMTTDVAAAEQQALGRVKTFCSRILKILAPPLL
jgi:hypothetical protein